MNLVSRTIKSHFILSLLYHFFPLSFLATWGIEISCYSLFASFGCRLKTKMRLCQCIPWMLNSQDHYGFSVPALMILLEEMVKIIVSSAVTGFNNIYFLYHSFFYSLYIAKLNLWFIYLIRQSGRSYLGILDYVSGSFSLLDIPLSDVTNVVCSKILYHCLEQLTN